MNQPKKKHHFPFLDAFRGIAVLLVFMFHYWTFYEEQFPENTVFSIFKIGHIGVDLFFILSGFLVTLSLWRCSSLMSYAKKRFWRIAPLAIGTIIPFWLIKTDFSLSSFLDLGSHILFINGFIPEYYHSINPVTWSISVEMAFYILLPALWIWGAKREIKKFLYLCFGLTILSFLYRAGITIFFENWNWEQKVIFSEQLWGRFDQFFLGIVLASFVEYRETIQKHSQKYNELFSKYSSIICIIGLFVIIGSASIFYMLNSAFREILFLQIFLHFFVGLGFFLFLLGLLVHNQPQREDKSQNSKKRKNINILSFLGSISYGIYLLHFPILSQVSIYIQSPLLGFFTSISFTIFLSWISWNWFEKKMIK